MPRSFLFRAWWVMPPVRVLLKLFPALLRTIHLGIVTLALEHNAGQLRDLPGATRTKMLNTRGRAEGLYEAKIGTKWNPNQMPDGARRFGDCRS
jgi:hypothetical protein